MRGVLPIAVCALARGFSSVVVPHENAAEAAVVDGVSVYGARHLSEVVDMLNKPENYQPTLREVPVNGNSSRSVPDFGEVLGQTAAKRALEVAAAGCT